MAEWNAALDEKINAICGKMLAIFAAGSEEDKATWKAGSEGLKAAFTGEQKAELMGEMAVTFKSCDTDESGSLNEAQYMDFAKKAIANNVARGFTTAPVPDELIKESFDCAKDITDGPGVSMADFMCFNMQRSKVVAGIMAAAAGQ